MFKKIGLLIVLVLLMAVTVSAEQTKGAVIEEELPEGLYIYTPLQGQTLPWVETELGNEYQIIGLAPHDCTVSLELKNDGNTIWQKEIMSEGNGYFFASVSSDMMDSSLNYLLKATCLTYESLVEFSAYSGTLTDYAVDPIHLEVLGDLTEEEKEYYTAQINNLEYYITNEEEPETEEGQIQGVIQTGLNEYRNNEYSYRIEEDGTATLLYYYGHKRHLELPTIIDGHQVAGATFSPFNNALGVVTVTIPASITRINRAPFQWWQTLTAIYVPQDHTEVTSVNGVLYSRDLRTLVAVPAQHPEKDFVVPEGTIRLNDIAFSISSIRKISLPDSLRSVGDSCFSFSRYLREVILPDSVRVLEEGCLRDCGIRKLSIPSKAAITGSPCQGCENLEEIIVMPGNETAKSVDGVLFSADGETLITYPANKKDKEYTIPFGTTEIAADAFKSSGNLEKVDISEGVVALGESAFSYSGIRSVKMPKSLVQLGNQFFDANESLEEILVSSENPILDAVDNKYLYSKDHEVFYCYPAGLNEREYVLDEKTKIIAGGAFGKTKLSKVFLPDALEEIGDHAFWSSALAGIYIPGNVRSVGHQALSFCSQLEMVGVAYGVKELSSSVFASSEYLKTITIPETVDEIGKLSFLRTGNAVIYTVEGSFAHQYAVNNQLNADVRPGNYEKKTQEIKTKFGFRKGENGASAIKTSGKAGNAFSAAVVVTHNGTVNIRENADAESRRVAQAQPGDSFRWLETVQKGKSTWYKIELPDGAEGFISAKMSRLSD